MHVDDALHGGGVGKFDVVKEAASQKSIRQFFFIVRGDEHQGPVFGFDELACLVAVELHAVDFAQQVIRKFDVGLVDLVNQQRDWLFGGKGLPQHALDNVVVDVLDPLTPVQVRQLGVAQSADCVVLIQALLRLGGRFDVPLEQRHVQRARHLLCQHGFTGARLALNQQGPLQCDGRVDGQHQVLGGDVV